MAHFRTTDDIVESATIHISGEEALHAHTVRRCTIGDTITVAGRNNATGTAVITDITPTLITLTVTAIAPPTALSSTMLGFAVTKKPALEEMVQHATELGATEIALWHSDHSPLTLPDIPTRLTRIATEACKQSDRPTPPDISLHGSLTTLLTYADNYHLVVLDQYHHEPPSVSKETPICLIVGPEGGISKQEQITLTAKNPSFLSLSSFTLRAPTAALAGLSAVNFLRQ